MNTVPLGRSLSDTLKSNCHFFPFSKQTSTYGKLPIFYDGILTPGPPRHDGNLRDRENNGGYETEGPEGGPCQASHSHWVGCERTFLSSNHPRKTPGVSPQLQVLMDSGSRSVHHPCKQARYAGISQEPADREASSRVWSQGPVATACSLQRISITVSCKQKRLRACLYRCTTRQAVLGWLSLGYVEGDKKNPQKNSPSMAASPGATF